MFNTLVGERMYLNLGYVVTKPSLKIKKKERKKQCQAKYVAESSITVFCQKTEKGKTKLRTQILYDMKFIEPKKNTL